MTRENDIQELCKQVKESDLVTDYRGNPHCCPFCIVEAGGDFDFEDSVFMGDINHLKTCAYLIAKDLSAGVNK